jgi:uncharacterized protein YuzE
MKISIDNEVDALHLRFNNNNKVAETIELEQEILIDIDSNNKVIGLEVLHYSKLKQWINDLLKESNLSLNEDSVVFYLHHGYIAAWFDMRDVKKEYTVCKYYLEAESIQYDLVQNFIQDEIDFIIRNRNIINSKYINVISDSTQIYYK